MKRFLFSTALALVLVLESRGAGSRALITDKTTGELKFADPTNEAQFIDLATGQFKFNHTTLNFGNAANQVPILGADGSLLIPAGGGLAIGTDLILVHPLTPSPDNAAETIIGLGFGALSSLHPDHQTQYLTALGYMSQRLAWNPHHNTTIGAWTLSNCPTCSNITAIGLDSGRGLLSDSGEDTMIGEHTGAEATTGLWYDVFIGNNAGFHAGGKYQHASGYSALFGNSTATPLTGWYNSADGAYSLYNLKGSSTRNTADGFQSGYACLTCNGNVFLGDEAGSTYPVNGDDNFIVSTAGNIANAPGSTSSFTMNIVNLIKGAAINSTTNSVVTFTGTKTAADASNASVVLVGGLGVGGSQSYFQHNVAVGGVPTPDSILHVYTGSNLGGLRIGRNGTSENDYDANTHNFRSGVGGTVLTINGLTGLSQFLGNVAVGGPISPDSIFHVVTGTNLGGLRIGKNGASENYYDANNHYFRSALGGNVLTLDGTTGLSQFLGNVAIGGVPTPDSILHVYTGSNLGGLRIGLNGTSVNDYDANTHNFRSGVGGTVLTIDGSTGLSQFLGKLAVGGVPTPDSIFNVYNGSNLGGLRIGYNGTSVNYYDANTHIFRSGTGAVFATLSSLGFAGTTGTFTATANGATLLQLQRFTDTSPTGNFVDFQDAAGTSLWKVNITGFLAAGTVPVARISGLAQSAITDTTNATNISSGLLSPAYGGTGVNNGTKTITLGGNFATSGAYSSTLTLTGATNVTLPTSGTLAITSQLPLAATAVAHQFVTSYTPSTETFTLAQPDFSDLAGSLALAQIPNALVTYAKIQNVSATNRVLGRSTSGAGVIEEITVGSGLSLSGGTLTATGSGGTVTNFTAGNLSPIFTTSVATSTSTPALTFSISNAGAHQFLGNNTGSSAAPAYVQPDFSDLAGSLALAQMPNALVTYAKIQNVSATNRVLGRSSSGAGAMEEITVGGDLSQSGSTFTIVNSAVTLAKMADMATASFIGRNTSGTGAPEVLSATTAKNILALNLVDNTSDATKNAATVTLTNKTLTAPTINGGVLTALTGLAVRDTSAAFDVTIAATSSTTLTGGRALTLDLVNAARTIKLTGNPTLADWFDQSVKTTAAPTFAGLTLSGTIAGTPTWSSNQAITLSTAAQPNITSLGTLSSVATSGNATFGTTTASGRVTSYDDTSGDTIFYALRHGTNYGADLGVNTNVTGDFFIDRVIAGTATKSLTIARATGNVRLHNYGAGTASFLSDGTFSSSSDERMKDIDAQFTRGLADLRGIKPITYHWKKETGRDLDAKGNATGYPYSGFMAQNVLPNIPEAVHLGSDGMFTFDNQPVLAALVNAVNELDARLAKLEGPAAPKPDSTDRKKLASARQAELAKRAESRRQSDAEAAKHVCDFKGKAIAPPPAVR